MPRPLRGAGASESLRTSWDHGVTIETDRKRPSVALRGRSGLRTALVVWCLDAAASAIQESEGGVSARTVDPLDPTVLVDDAATGPAAKSSAGGSGFRSRTFTPDKPCQVCEVAGADPRSDPDTDGRREHSGALRGIDAARRGRRTPLGEPAHAGSIRPTCKRRRARVHRVRWGRPSRSPERRTRRPRLPPGPCDHRGRPASNAHERPLVLYSAGVCRFLDGCRWRANHDKTGGIALAGRGRRAPTGDFYQGSRR